MGSVAGQKRETFEPVTLGHIRSHCRRDLLVYCGSIKCNPGVTMNADHMSDDFPQMSCRSGVCSLCGIARALAARGVRTARGGMDARAGVCDSASGLRLGIGQRGDDAFPKPKLTSAPSPMGDLTHGPRDNMSKWVSDLRGDCPKRNAPHLHGAAT
jgi:hypothetical protein